MGGCRDCVGWGIGIGVESVGDNYTAGGGRMELSLRFDDVGIRMSAYKDAVLKDECI